MRNPLTTDWLHRPTTIYECERCGYTLDRPAQSCPYCPDSRTVEFVL